MSLEGEKETEQTCELHTQTLAARTHQLRPNSKKSKISSPNQNWTRSLARNSPRKTEIQSQSQSQILRVCTTKKSTQSSAYNQRQFGMPTIRSAGPLDPQPWQRRGSDVGTPIHQTQHPNRTETLPNCTRPTPDGHHRPPLSLSLSVLGESTDAQRLFGGPGAKRGGNWGVSGRAGGRWREEQGMRIDDKRRPALCAKQTKQTEKQKRGGRDSPNASVHTACVVEDSPLLPNRVPDTKACPGNAERSTTVTGFRSSNLDSCEPLKVMETRAQHFLSNLYPCPGHNHQQQSMPTHAIQNAPMYSKFV